MLLCCSVRSDAGMPRDNFLTWFSAYLRGHMGCSEVCSHCYSIHNTILYMYTLHTHTHTHTLNVGILIQSHLFIHAHALYDNGMYKDDETLNRSTPPIRRVPTRVFLSAIPPFNYPHPLSHTNYRDTTALVDNDSSTIIITSVVYLVTGTLLSYISPSLWIPDVYHGRRR